LREVDRLLKEGHTHVVDADLKGYFDTIPHDRLMALVEGSISDGRVLSLIESFPHQDIMTETARWQPETGTSPRLRGARLQEPYYLRCWRTCICIRSIC
jgi:RNA-directed DNA polymerase